MCGPPSPVTGLRTLVARVDAGDATAFLALVERVAECLADDGDEDPVAVRRSKAIGIIAYQARLRDLLARHADAPDSPPTPEERVAAHQGDPSDPWAADLPPAGWETARHGNVHQPCFDDLDDDCWTSQSGPTDDDEPWSEESPVDDTDLAWHAAATSTPMPTSVMRCSAMATLEHCRGDAGPTRPVPTACHARPSVRAGHVRPRPAAGARFDLLPFAPAEASSCGPRVVIHVHVSDQTLIDQHGVVRTEHGPVTLDQFRQWLTQADPTITIRPVLDPAATAPVDGESPNACGTR